MNRAAVSPCPSFRPVRGLRTAGLLSVAVLAAALAASAPAQEPQPSPAAEPAAPATTVENVYVSDLERDLPRQIVWQRDQSPMMLVPAGEFLRGSDTPRDSGGDADEAPARGIYVPSFYIDRFEVTNAQYLLFCRATGYDRPSFVDSDLYGRPDQPVVGVSHEDASAYARWAGKMLPTEAMWEKAARGVDGRLYPWGNELTGREANTRLVKSRSSAPVGSFEKDESPYGVRDMGGNVAEWVADWYAGDAYANAEQRSPAGPPTGERRVLRGGSWNFDADKARTLSRLAEFPTERKTVYGFRTAVIPGQRAADPLPSDTVIRVGEAAQRTRDTALPVEEQWSRLEDNLRLFFESHRPLLDTMRGDITRLYPAADRREVEFVNLTDRTVYITLVNQDRIVILYDVAIRVNAATKLRLPVDQTFRLYAIDLDDTPAMERLEDVTIARGADILTYWFDLDGRYRPDAPRHRRRDGQLREARRELALVNQAAQPVLFTVTDLSSLRVVREERIAPSDFVMMTPGPGDYRVVVKYVDALDIFDLTDRFQIEPETIRQSVVATVQAGGTTEGFPPLKAHRSVYVPLRGERAEGEEGAAAATAAGTPAP